MEAEEERCKSGESEAIWSECWKQFYVFLSDTQKMDKVQQLCLRVVKWKWTSDEDIFYISGFQFWSYFGVKLVLLY